MKNSDLPVNIYNRYLELRESIRARLDDFSKVQEDKYFYEFCFCLCTPQSKAASALIVQNELERIDYLNNPVDITELLRNPRNYIRFHNVKAKRIYDAVQYFPELMKLINSKLPAIEKRNYLAIKKISKYQKYFTIST